MDRLKLFARSSAGPGRRRERKEGVRTLANHMTTMVATTDDGAIRLAISPTCPGQTMLLASASSLLAIARESRRC